ncbi:MAG: phosphatidylserine/phosphatidylglycerophosphate/cardiolipin synthase family protein [Chloroflexia bacterium]
MMPNPTDSIETSFLCAGCQTSKDVAEKLASFLSQATESIAIAAYSFNLCPEERDVILAALKARAQAGVSIRIIYDQANPQALPPWHFDPCDLSTPQFVQSLGFPSRMIEGNRALMHHKYVVLDGNTPRAAVWTGSTNFTDDSWKLQENNVIILRSQELARYYVKDFEELWVDGRIESEGLMDSGEATLVYGGKPAYAFVNFSPGEGDWIDESIANAINRARESITIAAVVVTSTRLLRALLDAIERGVRIEGIYDLTQMEGVKYQWQLVPANTWKIGAFARIVRYGNLVGKRSTPYNPSSKHDYMHNKVMVLDDTVLTGSYNFSRHAQQNAENSLIIQSAPLAATYRDYIHRLIRMYAPQSENFSEGEAVPAATRPAPEAIG